MAARKQRHWEENNLETGEPDPVEELPSESKVVAGSLWMFAITMALFFLPVESGMIAGVIGGYRVGTTRTAVMAALGPLILVSFLLWMVLSLVPIPLMGSTPSQAALALLITLTDLGLLVGAAIGGTLAQNRIDRLNRA